MSFGIIYNVTSPSVYTRLLSEAEEATDPKDKAIALATIAIHRVIDKTTEDQVAETMDRWNELLKEACDDFCKRAEELARV